VADRARESRLATDRSGAAEVDRSNQISSGHSIREGAGNAPSALRRSSGAQQQHAGSESIFAGRFSSAVTSARNW
jgi:hypothetical protein